MGKQSRRRKKNNNIDQGNLLTATLIKFDEPTVSGLIFTKDTQFEFLNGMRFVYGDDPSIDRSGLLNELYDIVSDEYGVYIYPKGYVWRDKE